MLRMTRARRRRYLALLEEDRDAELLSGLSG